MNDSLVVLPLCFVIWKDAESSCGWYVGEEIKEFDGVDVFSIGFLLDENEDRVVLGGMQAGTRNEVHGCSIFSIPKACIQKQLVFPVPDNWLSELFELGISLDVVQPE